MAVYGYTIDVGISCINNMHNNRITVLGKRGCQGHKKDRNLVFVLIGTPGLDLTWSPSNGVMMVINAPG